jgi:hypothetical protein
VRGGGECFYDEERRENGVTLLLFVCEIEMNTSSPVLEQLSYSMLLFI